MSECTHDCSTCGESCGERTAPQSFLKEPNAAARIGKVYGVVSGKGGVGKSMVTSQLAVLARHGGEPRTGLGFVHGFGIRNGALASSVGHDSHNLCVVGANDGDMAVAVNALIECGGGFVAVENGKVLALLPLEIGGLISAEPFADMLPKLKKVIDAAHRLGCRFREPFQQLSFLPLPVIPHLRLTDRGLFDVDKFEFVREY